MILKLFVTVNCVCTHNDCVCTITVYTRAGVREKYYARLTFAIAANGDVTLVRLLKNLNILNKKYPIFDFDFDDFDSRVPAYRSHDNPARALQCTRLGHTTLNLVLEYTLEYYGMSTIDSTRVRSVRPYSKSTTTTRVPQCVHARETTTRVLSS